MRILPALGAIGLASYAGYVAVTWLRYGRRRASPESIESDALLDRFLPEYDVAERHFTPVAAPASRTLATACELVLGDSPVVRTLFRCREFLLRARVAKRTLPHGLLAEMKALGWTVLAEVPGQEIVMGAAAQPWEAKVDFRPLTPGEFPSFRDPRFVKIAWTLRADPVTPERCIFRTETRAIACGPRSRSKFRRYWAFLSPGVILIRLALLRALKRTAERRERYPAAITPEMRPKRQS